jgi:hypothetical protein
MQMRPQLQIQSMCKSLSDVVLPAVDPQNKLAQEQIRLVIGMLGLMAKQLPLQFRFDCDELARLVGFSRELQGLARGGDQTAASVASLASATTAAAAILERAKVSPGDVEHAVRSLRSASGSVVTDVFHDGEKRAQESVQQCVLAMSKEQLLRDRAWLISQGWEPDPKSVPDIATLLA